MATYLEKGDIRELDRVQFAVADFYECVESMLLEEIANFRRSYKGPKIAAVVLGGGYSFLKIRSLPGASEYFSHSLDLYDKNIITNFLNEFGKFGITEKTDYKFCSHQATFDALTSLRRFGETLYINNFQYVAVNSALTTNRYRKGNNVSYIVLLDSDNKRTYDLELPKIQQKIHEELLVAHPGSVDRYRYAEDMLIGVAVLRMILGKNPTTGFETLYADTGMAKYYE
jgi:hypothetical protein